MSTIYDAPGITYDGIPTNDSLLGAVNKIGQVWLHMNLDTLSPGGFTTDGISSAVLAALQATPIPANIKQVNDVTVQGAGTKLNPWQPV